MFSGSTNFVDSVDSVFLLIFGISGVLLAVVTFFMVYFIIKYNRKKNSTPKDIPGNVVLETICTVIPVILVLIMFYFGWYGFKPMREVPKDAMKVKVTARMWSWLFEYENGKQSDVLNLPIGKPVRLNLDSLDVVHSFYIPAFRIKQDAVPSLKNYLWFIPEKAGSYDIFCSEYCGQRHSYMLTKVVVMEQDKFNEWYGREKEKPEAATAEEKETPAREAEQGKELLKLKGCTACHTTDGKPSAGPTLKGLFGSKVTVLTGGRERVIAADEEYIYNSILDPNADIVKGFQPIMPAQKGLITDKEIAEITEYLKQLK